MFPARLLIVVFALALVAGCATGGAVTTPPPSPPAPKPTARTDDRTDGRFINATSWSLRVWVDPASVNGDRPATVTLQPGETVPWTLGRGEHRIVAHAHAPGPSGDKVVARFDRTVALDPKRPEAWFLRFREADFR
jgi:hypothetical protein